MLRLLDTVLVLFGRRTAGTRGRRAYRLLATIAALAAGRQATQ
jgi:hypothetical protein